VQPISTLDPALVAGCSPLQLGAGTHRLDPTPGWTVDQLVLRDRTGEAVQNPIPTPVIRVASRRPTAADISVGLARGPYTLVLGQAFDERWRATMDGHDLGPPVLVDGYSTGWDVPSGSPHTFHIRYAPQRSADVAVGFSAASALGAFVLVMRRPGSPPSPIAARGPTSRRPRKARSARRGWFIRWASAAAITALLLGWIAGLGVVVLALVHVVRRPRPITLLWAGFACWCALPVVWYLGNRGLWGQVTPRLVVDNPWPHVFACAGLILLLIGVGRQERARTLAHSAAMTEDVTQRDG
jgi:arabinofuranan 3-O-arabinosyltransferase